jgi:hypothetical protein
MTVPPKVVQGEIQTGPHTVGNMVRLSLTFMDRASGSKVNPTTVRFKSLSPEDRTPTTLVYGTDTALSRPSTGVYQVDLLLDAPGTWAIRWESTGNYVYADEQTIAVGPSLF